MTVRNPRLKTPKRAISMLRNLALLSFCFFLGGLPASSQILPEGQLEQEVRGEKIFDQGQQLFQEGTAESFRSALLKFDEARRVYSQSGNRVKQIECLKAQGKISLLIGDHGEALRYYEQSLLIIKSVNDRKSESNVLNDIAVAYKYLGENQKALDYLNQSLKIKKLSGDKSEIAGALVNIGNIHLSLGDYRKALENLAKAMLLVKSSGDKKTEANLLGNIGGVYLQLGEYNKALNYFEKVLPLAKETNYKELEAATINNLGRIYEKLDDPQKALNYFENALPLKRKIGDRRGEAHTLRNIGGIYLKQKTYPTALKYYLEALKITENTGSLNLEASLLHNIGVVYHESRDHSKALDYYTRSWLLTRAVGDREGEFVTINRLQKLWSALGNRRLAIFFGKYSVTLLQELRFAAQGLDKDTQKTFLRTNEDVYRNLAEMLIAENRQAEAHQIITLYRDQQFFDFSQDSAIAPEQLSLSPREASDIERISAALEQFVTVRSELNNFKKEIREKPLTEEQNVQITALNDRQQLAKSKFLTVLQTMREEFSQTPDEKDRVTEIKNLTEAQTVLREADGTNGRNSVALYTLIGEEVFYLLLVTPDSTKSFTVPIKAKDLNEKIVRFYALLQSPHYDPRPLGKEIYDIILKPLEVDLKKANARTLLWSLDGALRYVPMAALSPDGKGYLVEQYENVLLTRSDRARLAKSPNEESWSGTGFGSSRAQTVKLLGDKFRMRALPGVTEELQLIFGSQKSVKKGKQGLMRGEVFFDTRFTKDAFLENSKLRRRLIHISSHFLFRPGDDSRSFLILGDGTPLTLNEMKKYPQLFDGVELLTLSACSTAANQADASGREIDGFAELAQRLGAKSVLATLWAVSDTSTPQLMRDFYQAKQMSKAVTKAQALRQAQIALLNGDAGINSFASKTSGDQSAPNIKIVVGSLKGALPKNSPEIIYVPEQNAPLFPHDKAKPFAHPFYWSSFVLTGNWL
jgi:CHAT domain-containing protein/Tfp pilus assembly protein PilF